MPADMLSPNMERLELERQTANESLATPQDLSWPRYVPPTAEQRRAWLLQAWPDFAEFMACWQALRQIQRDLEICSECGARGLYAARGEYWIFKCFECGHRDHNLEARYLRGESCQNLEIAPDDPESGKC